MDNKKYDEVGDASGAERCRILVVDDDEWICNYLQTVLATEDRDIHVARTIDPAEKLLSQYDYSVVLCDIILHDENGIDLLRKVRQQRDAPEVIMITGQASIVGAVEAVKDGAFDYLTKPLDSNRLLQTVNRALDRRNLLSEVERLRSRMLASHGDGRLVVVSEEMRRVMAVVNAVSQTDAQVLIEGESGTGKELIARAIHRSSSRSSGPFVPVNCAALSESLLESELFGYEKGAFTGATGNKQGLFESAQHGTILLDEVAELPLSLQPALLRVLQNGEIRRVGSTTTQITNARVIASTNRSLKSLVAEGSFREDLYYRLRIVPIVVPPLRTRVDDILPLTQFFLQDFTRRLDKSFQSVAANAAAFLRQYTWSGNVRELENLIYGIVMLFDDKTLTVNQIEVLMNMQFGEIHTASWDERTSHPGCNNERGALVEQIKVTERTFIQKALEDNGGNQAKTAEELGISRTSLWRKLKKHNLS